MAELVCFVRARRSRPAGGNFHLLAQMKVTKAKGLEHDLAGSDGSRPEAAVHPRRLIAPPERCLDLFLNSFNRCTEVPVAVLIQQPPLVSGQGQQTDRIQALFFASFLLGQQKKGSRPPGRTLGGLSRQGR
jgi:hypothetical protein